MKAKLFTISFLLLTILTTAQDFPYTLTVLSEPYERLVEPTIHTTKVWDDPEIEIPIGFDFVFDTMTYQAVQLGYFTGGALALTPAVGMEVDFIFAYGSDIIDPGYNDGKSLGYIASKIEGEPGSRICKIEWNNVGFYGELAYAMTSNNVVNFQLWLYEGSNNIEWHFGPHTIKDPSVHDLGAPLMGLGMDFLLTGSSDFPKYLHTFVGDATAPTIETITNGIPFPSGLDSDPSNGTVYRLSSLYVGTEDISQIQSHISLRPTIVQNMLTIEADIADNEDLQVQLLDMTGHRCLPPRTLTGIQQIDLSALPAGTYLVHVRSEQAVWTEKIVKQ